MRHSRRRLDVETLRCRHVFVPQNALDCGVFHSQFLEVRCETATIRASAVPIWPEPIMTYFIAILQSLSVYWVRFVESWGDAEQISLLRGPHIIF
jgi:hypothetical protein